MSAIQTKYIADNAVINAKLAQMASNTVKANITGSTANPTDVAAVSGATASAFMVRDANANVQANNLIPGYTTTATAAGTTTLTVASTYQQFFTGTTTQTLILPVTSTLTQTGQAFSVTNSSTGIVTVQSSGANTILAQSPNTTVIYTCILTTGTTAASWNAVYVGNSGFSAPGPTIQKFLSGSGTYTTPVNVAFIQVTMVGAGGGGSGGGTTQPNGTAGTASTFGTSLLSAGGGGLGGTNGAFGVGGTSSLGSGPIGIALTGGSGMGEPAYNASLAFYTSGGMGGSTALSGGGAVAYGSAGSAGATNTGTGGGGGGANNVAGAISGCGGGGGGYINAIITSPSSTYSYTVGAAGTGGGAGTSGQAGGNGAAGIIVVTEYYFNGLGGAPNAGGAYTPTVTTLTSGSGTFTTPANASYITVQMVGGGAGGAGGGSGAGLGTAGGNTTFGTSLLAANGAPAIAGTGANSGTGGSASLGSGPIGLALNGGYGNPGYGGTSSGSGGSGGVSPFGGSGTGGNNQGGFIAGQNAITNTGSGGGGGESNTSSGSGGGGGSGGYVSAIITSPLATYAYAIGAGGTGGAAGTSGQAGGAGGSGVIIITTYYNNGAVGTATNVTGIVAVANGGTGLSASVNARYHGATATLSASDSVVTYTTKDFDSNNAYSGGTYTVAVTGKYQINASLVSTDISGSFSVGLSIYKNGVQQALTFDGGVAIGAGNSYYNNLSDIISCSSGDTITIQARSNGTTPSVSSSTTSNVFSIAWLGT